MSTATAAVYVRISFDPSGERAGVTRQRTDCETLARELGFTDLRLYEDNSVSAFSGKPREQFERMLSDIAAGRIATVIVWAADRLYRRLSDLERIVNVLDAAHVSVHAVKSGDIDLSTADGRLHARLLGSVAQHESEKKSERLTARARQRAMVEKRTPASTKPFGWRFADGGGLEIDPEQAAALAGAYADVCDGLSLRATWKRLSAKTDTGKMTASTLGRILGRPRNAGLASYEGIITGEAADGLRIVDVDTFERAAAILSDPTRRTSPGRPANTWLGGGLLRCGRCGGPMAAGRKSGAPVYVCTREKHLSRRRSLIDPKVLAMAGDVLAAMGSRGLLRQATGDDDTAHDLRRNIAAAEGRLDALAALLAAGDLDPADFATATAKIRAGMADDAAALTSRSQRPALAALATCEDVSTAWQTHLDTDSRDTVRAILGDLLASVTIDADHTVTVRWADWTGLNPSHIDAAWTTPTRRTERREKVAELHRQGRNIQQTAHDMGIQRETVRRDLKELGLYEKVGR